MKSIRVHFDKVGDRSIDTSLIKPFGYYETAIKKNGGNWEIHSQSSQPIEAQTAHAQAVELCEKALRFEER